MSRKLMVLLEIATNHTCCKVPLWYRGNLFLITVLPYPNDDCEMLLTHTQPSYLYQCRKLVNVWEKKVRNWISYNERRNVIARRLRHSSRVFLIFARLLGGGCGNISNSLWGKKQKVLEKSRHIASMRSCTLNRLSLWPNLIAFIRTQKYDEPPSTSSSSKPTNYKRRL